MSVLCGLARDYTELFIARLGVGIGEACLAPAAYSLISDYFRPQHHGRAMAIFTLGTIFGGGSSFILGGIIYSALKEHPDFAFPLVGAISAWRETFLVIGGSGLIVAPMLLMIREPARHAARTRVQAGDASLLTLKEYFSQHGRAVLWIMGINALINLMALGVTVWMPAFLTRTYGVSMSWIGHSIGMVLIGGALVGGLIGGWLADTAIVARTKGQKLNIELLGSVLTVPCVIVFPLADNPLLSVALFGVEALVLNMAICVAPSVLQDIVPNQLKGQVTALYWMVQALIATTLGPMLIALVTDYVFHNEQMLRYSIIAVGAPVMIMAALAAVAARATYQKSRTQWQAGVP
jgi:MFS family permease